MYNLRNINLKIVVCLMGSLIISGCSVTILPTPTATQIPPTETYIPPTATPTPITPTITPSVTPAPTLTVDTKELIQGFGQYFSTMFLFQNESWKKSSIDYLLETAPKLNIQLTAEELNSHDVHEQGEIIQRIEDDILHLYGTPGQALFAVHYYGESSIYQLLIAHDLEYKDIDKMKEAITISANAEDKALKAAKLLSIDQEIITEGETATAAIQELLRAELPTKDAIYDAYSKALFWKDHVNEALMRIPN
jgi:hypothetical protein